MDSFLRPKGVADHVLELKTTKQTSFYLHIERSAKCHQNISKKNTPEAILKYFKMIISYILFKKPAIDIVSVGKKHQGYQNEKTNHLGVFHKFVAWFTATHNLVE